MAKRRNLKREDKQLANQIRALRTTQGMTQEELSARLGLSRGLSLPVVYRIAKVFGVRVRDLFRF